MVTDEDGEPWLAGPARDNKGQDAVLLLQELEEDWMDH